MSARPRYPAPLRRCLGTDASPITESCRRDWRRFCDRSNTPAHLRAGEAAAQKPRALRRQLLRRLLKGGAAVSGSRGLPGGPQAARIGAYGKVRTSRKRGRAAGLDQAPESQGCASIQRPLRVGCQARSGHRTNPRTADQQRHRQNILAVSRRWRTLSLEQRGTWRVLAANTYFVNDKGQRVRLNCFKLFVSLNTRRADLGLPQFDVAPAQPVFSASPGEGVGCYLPGRQVHPQGSAWMARRSS